MENHFALTAGIFSGRYGQHKCFEVYRVDERVASSPTYISRGFRKLYLLTGKTRIRFAGKEIQVDGTVFLFEPAIPFAIKWIAGSSENFGCLVSRELLQSDFCIKAYTHLLSSSGNEGLALFLLNSTQKDFIVSIFEKLMIEQETGYVFNDELFCNYLNLMFYEVLKQLGSAQPGFPLVY